MIKCIYFKERTDYEYKRSTLVYSPMYFFNQWDQSDVEEIYSIHCLPDEQGNCKTIIVYYEAKDKD